MDPLPDQQPATDPQRHEPQFIGKLKGKRVQIVFHSRDTIEGTIVKYNRYELLLLESHCTVPVIVMKNSIAKIVPKTGDENPFEKKSEGEAIGIQVQK